MIKTINLLKIMYVNLKLCLYFSVLNVMPEAYGVFNPLFPFRDHGLPETVLATVG